MIYAMYNFGSQHLSLIVTSQMQYASCPNILQGKNLFIYWIKLDGKRKSAFTLPLSRQNLKAELNVIRRITPNNGYNSYIINKLIVCKEQIIAYP